MIKIVESSIGVFFYDDSINYIHSPIFESVDDINKFVQFCGGIDVIDALEKESLVHLEYKGWIKLNKPEKRVVKIMYDHVHKYEPEVDGINGSYFTCDMISTCHPVFIGKSNNDIWKELKKYGVYEFEDGEYEDSEYSCFYAFFRNEENAKKFVDALNRHIEFRMTDCFKTLNI
jgi:ribosomal protein L31